ncbi:MAG: hypothetical protein R3E33_02325 [Rhodocyclaceae bacterium]
MSRSMPTAASYARANYNGPDNTYLITDADGDVSTATATINVAPTKRHARSPRTTWRRRPNTPVIIDVLGNDSDPDGDV